MGDLVKEYKKCVVTMAGSIALASSTIMHYKGVNFFAGPTYSGKSKFMKLLASLGYGCMMFAVMLMLLTSALGGSDGLLKTGLLHVIGGCYLGGFVLLATSGMYFLLRDEPVPPTDIGSDPPVLGALTDHPNLCPEGGLAQFRPLEERVKKDVPQKVPKRSSHHRDHARRNYFVESLEFLEPVEDRRESPSHRARSRIPKSDSMGSEELNRMLANGEWDLMIKAMEDSSQGSGNHIRRLKEELPVGNLFLMLATLILLSLTGYVLHEQCFRKRDNVHSKSIPVWRPSVTTL